MTSGGQQGRPAVCFLLVKLAEVYFENQNKMVTLILSYLVFPVNSSKFFDLLNIMRYHPVFVCVRISK